MIAAAVATSVVLSAVACVLLWRLVRRPVPAVITAEMVRTLDQAATATARRTEKLTAALERAEIRVTAQEEQIGTIAIALKSIEGYCRRSWQFVTDHADENERLTREQTTAIKALRVSVDKTAADAQDQMLDISENLAGFKLRIEVIEKAAANGGGHSTR